MDTTPLNRRPKHEPEDEGWLITFADMCVLMMCFFLIMYALTSTTSQTMANIAKSLRDSGFYDAETPQIDPLEEAKKQITKGIGIKGYDQFMAPQETPGGMEIEIASSAFFEKDSAKFVSTALPMLTVVSDQIAPLAKEDVLIEVEGHTDNTAVASAQFPSNWELSSARAANVARYFIAQKFPANKIRVIGLADTKPKAANYDAAGNPLPGNQNLNRRVVIRILRGADN
jgi:chemotaxis protein MotB